MKPTKSTAVHILTAILTPLVAAASAALAKKGLSLPNGAVVTIGVAGGLAVLQMGREWLGRLTVVKHVELTAEKLGAQVSAAVTADPTLKAALHDLADAVDSQRDAIVAAVGNAVKAPPSAEEVAQKILDQAVSAKVASAGVPPARVVGVIQPDPPAPMTTTVPPVTS